MTTTSSSSSIIIIIISSSSNNNMNNNDSRSKTTSKHFVTRSSSHQLLCGPPRQSKHTPALVLPNLCLAWPKIAGFASLSLPPVVLRWRHHPACHLVRGSWDLLTLAGHSQGLLLDRPCSHHRRKLVHQGKPHRRRRWRPAPCQSRQPCTTEPAPGKHRA